MIVLALLRTGARSCFAGSFDVIDAFIPPQAAHDRFLARPLDKPRMCCQATNTGPDTVGSNVHGSNALFELLVRRARRFEAGSSLRDASSSLFTVPDREQTNGHAIILLRQAFAISKVQVVFIRAA
jgi:hypothetical protein